MVAFEISENLLDARGCKDPFVVMQEQVSIGYVESSKVVDAAWPERHLELATQALAAALQIALPKTLSPTLLPTFYEELFRERQGRHEI
jgi:hypothetical protein